MQTFYYPDVPKVAALAVATGFFDGVHRGHRAILAALTTQAKLCNIPSAAITYMPHPRSVLHVEQKMRLLTTFVEKEELIAAQGIDYLIVIPFTTEFSKLTMSEFLRYYLMERLCVKELIIGYNQRIGSDGISNFNTIKQICHQLQINVKQPPAVVENSIEISSTKIRQSLADGDVVRAHKMLGIPYFVSGSVVRGSGIGRTIGFPTANISVAAEKILPQDGVYAVMAQVSGHCGGGMLNIGCRPTINADGVRSVEVHIFDFQQSIYGETLTIHFMEHLRAEQKFSSLAELKSALIIDMQAANKVGR